MKSEKKEVKKKPPEKDHLFIPSSEDSIEKEIVTLIATILVNQTLKNATEKGYQIPEI